MTIKNPIDIRQDRREWLKTPAAALGASLLPMPAVSAETPQAAPAPAAPQEHTGTKSTGRFFTPAQHALVEELSETIIPADSHSGGAKAAKVADCIDQILRDTLDDPQKALWRDGLRLVDLMTRHYSGKTFVDANSEERVAVLTVLSDNDHMTELPEVRFFVALKRMTVDAYYTSKIGIHDELEYKGNRICKSMRAARSTARSEDLTLRGEMEHKGRVKVGIIGSQFQADIHAAALQIMPHEAEVIAVASPTPGNAAEFAKRFGIPDVHPWQYRRAYWIGALMRSRA